MPVSPEKIAPGKCYTFKDSAPRRILLMQDGKLTFVLRSETTWTVQRYHQDVDTFARAAECEIECATLRTIAEEPASENPPSTELPTELPS